MIESFIEQRVTYITMTQIFATIHLPTSESFTWQETVHPYPKQLCQKWPDQNGTKPVEPWENTARAKPIRLLYHLQTPWHQPRTQGPRYEAAVTHVWLCIQDGIKKINLAAQYSAQGTQI